MPDDAQNGPEFRDEYDHSDVLAPGFRLLSANDGDRPCRKLYLQTFSRQPGSPDRWASRPSEQWPLLATIYADRVVMQPVHAYPYAQRYLSPRHGRIHTVIFEYDSPRELPETADEAVGQLEYRLPHRIFNPCSHGLGLNKELDPLWVGLYAIRDVDTLVVASSGSAAIDGSTVRLSLAVVDEFRRRFERAKRIAQDNVKLARRWMVRNELLPKLDSQRFPRVEVVAPAASLVELRRAGVRQTGAAARAERRSTVQAVRNNLPELAVEEPRALLQLHADIERVTLEGMISRFEEMLQQNLPEARWQRFFEDNSFILSLLFARPVRLLHTQFHAQGSGVTGAGAQVGDFLLAERGQGLAIVEIKKPGTDVVAGSAYRNTDVYGPSSELAGSVTQVLYQQSAMRTNWYAHRDRNESLRDSRSDAIRCIVIVGVLPTDQVRRRSFEVFRNACKDVDVITFDELLGKLKLLHQHLVPTSNEAEVPF